MDDGLRDVVLRRLADESLAEPAADLLLAALDSDESLSAQIGGQAAQQPAPDGPESATPPQPVNAYLRTLTVEGWRCC